MMNLEDLVNKKREDADIVHPSPHLWNRIESQLPADTTKPKLNWPPLAVAASLLLCIGIGYFWGKNSASGTQSYADIKALDPQYARQMATYNGVIQEKRKTLASLKAYQPTLYVTFEQDWRVLEKSYQELRDTLPNHPNQEELLKAMIDNLRWQSDLLEQQVRILENLKSPPNTDELA